MGGVPPASAPQSPRGVWVLNPRGSVEVFVRSFLFRVERRVLVPHEVVYVRDELFVEPPRGVHRERPVSGTREDFKIGDECPSCDLHVFESS